MPYRWFLDREQLHQLKQAGIDRINHNLNTPEENSTPTLQRRIASKIVVIL